MYRGKQTKELDNLKATYERMFGYDPDGEIELEFGDDYEDYYSTLKKCVDQTKDIFEILGEWLGKRMQDNDIIKCV